MCFRTALLTIVLFVGFTSPSFSTPSDTAINAVLGDRSWSSEHSTPPSSADEVLRIRTHLRFVQNLLWQTDTSHLSPAQRGRRFAALHHLEAYTDAGVFPKRDVADGFRGRRPQFIDARGVHCAVGELIRHSGAASLATAIDDQWEYAYVEEIESAELSAWAEHHGFTAHELAMIQPTYRPQTTAETVETDVQRLTDGLVIRCGAEDEVPKRLAVRVNGDEAGDITVEATSASTPFAKCFVSGLRSALNGMRKIAATPFTRELALELPTPQALAQQRLNVAAAESCTRESGPRPTHVELRLKSGDGKIELFVETTPRNEKIEACVQADFRRVFHGFRHGKWTFDISASQKVRPIVDAGRLRMGLETVTPLAASMCEAKDQKFTVEAAIKKGATKVDIVVKGGPPKFRTCVEKVMGEITTNFMLRSDSREVLESDADIKLSHTHDPGPQRAGE